MRLIDADTLDKVKFHPLPYTHITPSDADAESYKRGWNDAVDAIMSEAPTIEERKTGTWIDTTQGDHYKCSCCGTRAAFWFNEENSSGWERDMSEWLSDYCPNCGARMER